MSILNILANDGFICVNKHIIKNLGLNEAIIIGELASIHNYNKMVETLLDEKWFYATVDKIEANTGLTDYIQKQTIDKLCEIGILEQKLTGMPRRRYLAFNEEKLVEMLTTTQLPNFREQASENSDTSTPKIRIQASENSDTIYNKTINNNTYDNTPQQGGGNLDSNKKVLEIDNNQKPKPPRVSPPAVSVGAQLSNALKNEISNYTGVTKEKLVEYFLYLKDSYNMSDSSLRHRLRDLQRKARNIPDAIEAIIDYNITRNYKLLYLPNDLSATVAQAVAISEQAVEEDFVRDENGNIEEDW